MGAWEFTYAYNKANPLHGHSDRLGWAILSLKNELAFNGHRANMILRTQVFGSGTDIATREFQSANPQCGRSDGVIGFKTAMVLWRRRKVATEEVFVIPDHWLAKQITLESANDPAATGMADKRDRGLSQISSLHHPEITDSMAFNAAYSINWHGKQLKLAHAHFNGDWEAAIVSWNVGWGGAAIWIRDGKPEDSRAGKYLTAVKGAPW